MQPKRWPKRLLYARESTSSEMNMDLLRSFFCTNNPEDNHKRSWVIEEKCIYPHLAIKKLQKPHPLSFQKTKKGYVNYGVFATRKIEPDVALGEYIGELFLRPTDYHKVEGGGAEQALKSNYSNVVCSEYSWSVVYDHFLLTIDCHRIANELAFINDYRGIYFKPNVRMQPIIHKGFEYYGYVTICEIQEGEEILVDYTPHRQ